MDLLTKRPHFERYMLTGTLVFVLGHFQYRGLYALLDVGHLRAGIAWGLHFVFGTVWSHALHREITFRGTTQRPYLASLLRTFGAYSIMLALSTLAMIVLCDWGGLSALLGWGVVTVLLALGNYAIMSRWTICGSPEDDPHEP